MLLGKIKLYDIAKELNLTSKEVLEIAKKLNIEAKSHLSSVNEEDAKKIKENAIKPKKTEEKKAAKIYTIGETVSYTKKQKLRKMIHQS